MTEQADRRCGNCWWWNTTHYPHCTKGNLLMTDENKRALPETYCCSDWEQKTDGEVK
jgi:hypothetical protein